MGKKPRLRKTGNETLSTHPRGETHPIGNVQQLRAIAHPLRLQLIEQFAIKPATTKQVAERLGLPPTRLYHHVAKLENAGLLMLVDTRQVRGTTEKYFSTVAARLEIDHNALNTEAGISNKGAEYLGIVDSLFGNAREEIANHLSHAENTRQAELSDDSQEQQILLVSAEFSANEPTAHLFRQKLTQLVTEFEEHARNTDDDPDSNSYRVIISCYPCADAKS